MGKRSCVTLVEELIRQRDQARDEAHADRKSNYVLALENKYLKERLYGPNTHPAAIASLKEMLEFFLQQENSQILTREQRFSQSHTDKALELPRRSA